MRLFLLPISTRQSLIYCHRFNIQLSSKATLIDKITSKASGIWLKWEKKDSGWQKKVTSYGNSLFHRLPYEEWALKSIPPLRARRKTDEIEGKEEVRLEFPELFVEPQKVWRTLQALGSKEKQAFHTKWLLGSVVGMPLTIPFALIPMLVVSRS